jgi:hypothetical protein
VDRTGDLPCPPVGTRRHPDCTPCPKPSHDFPGAETPVRCGCDTGGRPKVIDEDMLTFARALRDKGVAMPEIAKKLTIVTGKNAGNSPSVTSFYRPLAGAS